MREFKTDVAVGFQDKTAQGIKSIEGNLKTALTSVFKIFEEVNRAADGSGKVSQEVLEELGMGLEALAEAFASSSKRIADTNQETFESLGKDFEKLFDEFNASTALEEFAKLTVRTFEELEDTIVKTIKSGPEKLVEGFEEELGRINTTFVTMKNFGRDTARDLNTDFNSFFKKGFREGTLSIGDLWKSVTNTMKDNFIDALAAMAARLATSAVFKLLEGGLDILKFGKGGLIPAGEDGMFLGRSGEGVLTPEGVARVGGKAGLKALNRPGAPGTDFIGPPTAAQNFLNEAVELRNATTFETSLDLSNPSTITAKNISGSVANAGLNIGAGIAGSELAGAFVPASKEASIGSAVGGAIGSAAGPLGAFAGAFFGGLVGSIFGGERLSETEREFGALFKQFRPNFDDPFSALAFTRLKQPGTGADSVADALNNIVGRDLFPGTSFLRDNAGAEGVNALTVKGFNNLVELGKLDRESIIDGLVQDLVFFKGKFASGLDFVPHDDFPAFLHRGERVLTESENRRLSLISSQPDREGQIVERLDVVIAQNEKLIQGQGRQEVAMDGAKLEVNVKTYDLDDLTEHIFKIFDRKVRDRQIIIDAAVIV